ncbi:hypothetical protein [Microbulbifer variabilis]|uniref:hypothetical protein n=1 Tax=Microbulbifer variabilis TaxID=266805 RepID=UPI001CFD1C86|nr:hypothetical protein [Microbulbifer variabilis]
MYQDLKTLIRPPSSLSKLTCTNGETIGVTQLETDLSFKLFITSSEGVGICGHFQPPKISVSKNGANSKGIDILGIGYWAAPFVIYYLLHSISLNFKNLPKADYAFIERDRTISMRNFPQLFRDFFELLKQFNPSGHNWDI